MDATHGRSQTPDLSHSIRETLLERTQIPEYAPRIKIGDQYYHVVRVVGGRYEAPISNPRELEKATRIGEVFFSAHKRAIAQDPSLAERKIEYVNEEGVHYERGITEGSITVANDKVAVGGEDAINYLKASGNHDWQQPVIAFEQYLGTRTDNVPPAQIPRFLKGHIHKHNLGHGPFTVHDLKRILIDYTREKLIAAHDIYMLTHPNPERHREDIIRAIDREIALHQSATGVIGVRNDYFQAGYIKTSDLWKMMVNTLQPQELRLLPAEEEVDLESELSSQHGLSTPIPIPNPRSRSSSVDLSSPLLPPQQLDPLVAQHQHLLQHPSSIPLGQQYHSSAFTPLGSGLHSPTSPHPVVSPTALRHSPSQSSLLSELQEEEGRRGSPPLTVQVPNGQKTPSPTPLLVDPTLQGVGEQYV